MKKSLELSLMGVLCQSLAGCVYGPFYDDTIPNTTSAVTFNLYATQPSVLITAECATHFSGFSQFGSKLSNSTPFTLNGESIYSAQLVKVVPANCWDFGFGKPLTFLRFFQTGNDGAKYSVQVFDKTAPSCISDHFDDGEGPVAAGFACRKTDSSQQLRLFANF